MKIVGIIVEYNPLHNGHLYHFNQIKKMSNADIIIAVMSSSIVNRGEISVFTKFDKAKLALDLGVDIVVELPSVYTLQNADVFAYRAVSILNYLNTSEIWIGSESNNITLYKDYYNVLDTNKYNDILKESLNKGLSYKASSNNAFKAFNLEPLLSNDMLGLAYYKAILNNNYNITLHTIKREGNNYLDTDNTSELSSASSIRLNQENIINQVPDYTYSLYKEKGFIDNSLIFNYLKLNILNNKLDDIFLIEEGFHNSLKNIYRYNDLDTFLKSLNTKRYTNTRIKRIFLSILFNLTKEQMKVINDIPTNYVRVLGYNNNGKNYLSIIKKDKTIYTNIKEGINIILDIEIKISKILDTIYNLNLLENEQKGPQKKEI
ncbi:MAG: nucleotidyltransferase family protein [Anaeroplasmataceae bacterium]